MQALFHKTFKAISRLGRSSGLFDCTDGDLHAKILYWRFWTSGRIVSLGGLSIISLLMPLYVHGVRFWFKVVKNWSQCITGPLTHLKMSMCWSRRLY